MFKLSVRDASGEVISQLTCAEGVYTAGRAAECDVVLPSQKVSRQHARLIIQGDRCYVEDLGSANGVLVDGQRVVGRRDLGRAGQIQIGDFQILVQRSSAQTGGDRVLQTLFIPQGDDHYKLVRINDAFAGEEFILSETENTIGRTDANFILLSDDSVSRQHARILRHGDEYAVEDNGSSNHSFVNDKKLDRPTIIHSGDRVKFGNVEFVFVPGQADVDLQAFARASTSEGLNPAQIMGMVAVVLLAIAVGGAIVFAMSRVKKQDTPSPTPTPAVVKGTPAKTLGARVEALATRGDKELGRYEWTKAIGTFDEVLALAPDHPDARDKKARATREREAAEQLERGEELSEQGKHEDASEIFKKIPKGTHAYERAQRDLKHARSTIAYNLKNEALRLSKDSGKKPLKEAHDKIVRALALTPEDADALALVRELEKKLDRARVKYDKYDK